VNIPIPFTAERGLPSGLPLLICEAGFSLCKVTNTAANFIEALLCAHLSTFDAMRFNLKN
jgi:hypothetical protein